MVERNISNKGKGEKRLIGVAWPYVNGELHIGHMAGYLLPADIYARYSRLKGNDVLMVSGSDCHGTPITVEADQKGVSPKEIADHYHKIDQDLLINTLNLSYDIYTRTDSSNHEQEVQKIFTTLLKKGYVYIDSQEQYYSPEEERFLPDRYVEGVCGHCRYKDARSDQCDNCGQLLDKDTLLNPLSKLSGEPVSLKETEHYFVNWEKLQPDIERYVSEKGPQWKKWVYKETKGWLKRGLSPRAVTRDMNWGVRIPTNDIPDDMRLENAENKRIYVWFDAVVGYLSASKLWSKEGGGDWKSYWYNKNAKHSYFMGKDNLVFHTIFWPGQLIGYDENLHLPDQPSINMFLNHDGKQFSKSRGESITIEDMVKNYGNDTLRFYLTQIMPENKDSSFRWNDFKEKVNGDLVGNFGNYIHRVLSIGRGSNIQAISNNQLSEPVVKVVERAYEKSENHLENYEFRNYLDSLLSITAFGNIYFNRHRVWEKKHNGDSQYFQHLKDLYYLILTSGQLMRPLMPESSDKLYSMLRVNRPELWPNNPQELENYESLIGTIDTSVKPTPLFKKLD
ncbi:methionine--tRNA ligase [Patescibacteria group bacterium]|nr:methionine--tRNA ligase [Patescibacteria group bacterium]MBU1256813.1 methionine--tRNA ligase [Patescibacteria group bacterium]MBU1457645.1 methionine--tRNA ligase [Patescibacteria group bacterium]